MIKIIIWLVIGYFIGLISCLYQVLNLEEKHNKKLKTILEKEQK